MLRGARPKRINLSIDLQNPVTATNQLRAEAMPQITQLLNDLLNSTLNPAQFPFAATQNSGLSKKIGLYAIVNTKTKKLYLGGASDMSQRKGDHYRSFNNPAKSATMSRLSKPMLADLQTGSINDFCFVPILIVDKLQILNAPSTTTAKPSLNQQINRLLDDKVEQPLLNTLFQSHPGNIYNTKAVGAFQAGNTAGGSPLSGSPDAPFVYILDDGTNPKREYAWESVSAGAKCFGVTNKSVRHIRDVSKKVKPITTAEFDTFQGTKITNANAALFATTNQTEFAILVRKLFTRRANQLGVP